LDTPLLELIRQRIRAQGPQSFAWFVKQALYHREHGYYSSGRCIIGRKGDYFTSVSVGPLFGQLLGAQFGEIWDSLGKIDRFTIVEQGAHDGQLARDILDSVQKDAPDFFAALRYQIVEPFAVLQERQARTLEAFQIKVEWHDALQPFTGVHFSNELLDAMPVRLINNGREKFVDLDGDKFVFIERQVGHQEEFNDAALNWIDEVAAKLRRGYILIIDYGHWEQEFHANVHVRMKHRHLDSPFEQIGHADITMPVDWRSIAERARQNGLRIAGFTDQNHFLVGIISQFASGLDKSSLAGSPKAKRELQTLLHPEMLGRAFQVLALEKGIDLRAPQLAGFKFASEPPFA